MRQWPWGGHGRGQRRLLSRVGFIRYPMIGSGHGVGPQRGWSWEGSAKVVVKGWVHQMEEPNDRITRQIDLGGGLSGGVVKSGAIRNAWTGGSKVRGLSQLLPIH